MKKALVVGSNGYIGSYLSNTKVSEIEFIPWDQFSGDKSNINCVVYCAGKTSNYSENFEATYEAHVKLLQEMANQFPLADVINLSSVRLYDDISDRTADETTPIILSPQKLQRIFDITKLIGELILEFNAQQNYYNFRISNIYGNVNEDTKHKGFMNSLIYKVKHTSEPIKIENNFKRDYLYIKDLSNIIAYFIKSRPKSGVYNIASGVNISNEMLIKITKKIKCNLDISLIDFKLQNRIPNISIEKLNSVYPYDVTPIDQGFKNEIT